jgi:hypothetical protein
MLDGTDGQIRLPVSNYPVGTIVCHYAGPDIRWRLLKHNRDEEDGPIKTVTLQRVGGEFNRGVAIVDADCDSYLAVGGRLRGRMRQRAMQQRRAAATPPNEDVVNPKKAEARPISRAKRADKPAKPTPKAAVEPTNTKIFGPRSKGVHSRTKASVPITSLKLDPRNPFGHGSRIHAYFKALLDGNGRATYGQMVAECLSCCEEWGVEDTEKGIRRDLNNQTHQWQKGKWGLLVTRDDSRCQRGRSGRLAKGEHDKVVFTCVAVDGHSWDEHLASHRR